MNWFLLSSGITGEIRPVSDAEYRQVVDGIIQELTEAEKAASAAIKDAAAAAAAAAATPPPDPAVAGAVAAATAAAAAAEAAAAAAAARRTASIKAAQGSASELSYYFRVMARMFLASFATPTL